jgi:hypothetical protein
VEEVEVGPVVVVVEVVEVVEAGRVVGEAVAAAAGLRR